jgi:hypothetical protein
MTLLVIRCIVDQYAGGTTVFLPVSELYLLLAAFLRILPVLAPGFYVFKEGEIGHKSTCGSFKIPDRASEPLLISSIPLIHRSSICL